MKLVIIGGGNMGSSIVKGLLKGSMFSAEDITVIDINKAPLDNLKKYDEKIKVTLKDYSAVHDADIVLLAVKPWLVEDVIIDIKFGLDYSRQILISIAAGVSIETMYKTLAKPNDENIVPTLFRVVPNTAIAYCCSLNLIATKNAKDDQKKTVMDIFNGLGRAVMIEEDKISAATAVSSCGIAYILRYVRAATTAGVELGLYPKQAEEFIAYTLKGASELLLNSGKSAEDEIDKVTTPGGLTIKGINELEANGFSNAIIQAIKVSK